MGLQDIRSFIDKWGIQGRPAGKEFYALCPLHGDKTPSMSINLNTGAWICYAASCGEKGNSIFSLGAKIFHQPIKEVIESHGDLVRDVPVDELIAALSVGNNADDSLVPASYEKDFISLAAGLPKWFVDRGFREWAILDYGIRSNAVDGGISIPVYFQERYYGYIKRLSPLDSANRGYRYFYNGFDKAQILFGLDALVKRHGSVPKLLMLTEGSLDTLWMQHHGYPAVSVLGSYISEYQLHWLKAFGVEEICLALDDDEEGKVAQSKMAIILFPFFKLWQLDYPPKPPGKRKQDPQDLQPEFLTKYRPIISFTPKELL